MHLSAFSWREHDDDHHTVDNDGELLISVGVVHEQSGQVLIITAHPTGELTFSYGPIDHKPHAQHLLGRFDEHGALEIHEPHPL